MDKLEKKIKETKVRLCLDCGKCTVVCPVAQYNPEFNPRLIIQKSLGGSENRAGDDSIWKPISRSSANFLTIFSEFLNSAERINITY